MLQEIRYDLCTSRCARLQLLHSSHETFLLHRKHEFSVNVDKYNAFFVQNQ